MPNLTRIFSIAILPAIVTGCAPAYFVHPNSLPNETWQAQQWERSLGAAQTQQLHNQGVLQEASAIPETGPKICRLVKELSEVSERPNADYKIYILSTQSFNAMSTSDGGICITQGLLNYLSNRPNRENELAFVIGHEIGHFCAQHGLKRLQRVQAERVAISLARILGGVVAAAYANPYANVSAQMNNGAQMSELAAKLIVNIQESGYNQGEELEADQFGIRYMRLAGYNPDGIPTLLSDMQRFDPKFIMFRTHPPYPRRSQDAALYIQASSAIKPRSVPPDAIEWKRVSLTTVLPGAHVYMGTEYLGQTPCEVIIYRSVSQRSVKFQTSETLGQEPTVKEISIPPIPETIQLPLSTPKPTLQDSPLNQIDVIEQLRIHALTFAREAELLKVAEAPQQPSNVSVPNLPPAVGANRPGGLFSGGDSLQRALGLIPPSGQTAQRESTPPIILCAEGEITSFRNLPDGSTEVNIKNESGISTAVVARRGTTIFLDREDVTFRNHTFKTGQHGKADYWYDREANQNRADFLTITSKQKDIGLSDNLTRVQCPVGKEFYNADVKICPIHKVELRQWRQK